MRSARGSLPASAAASACFASLGETMALTFQQWKTAEEVAAYLLALPHEANAGERLDFGPNWQRGILTLQPPRVGQAFPILVPQVDRDGNERDGVRLPEITVPLATITGALSLDCTAQQRGLDGATQQISPSFFMQK